MPIIFSYPQISTVSNQDLFVISKVNTSTGVPETKSVEAQDLSSYFFDQVNLNFTGNTGTAAVNLLTQSLSIEGTANEIETVATQGTSRGILTIGLPDNVTITNSLSVGSTNFTNIGAGSATIGSQNEASGAYSFAAGELNNAIATQSAAFNFETQASGPASSSFGAFTVASGANSFASGNNTLASGLSSFAAGGQTIASGEKSVAFGQGSQAANTAAIASGFNSNANGFASISMGHTNVATQQGSIALGEGSTASGAAALAAGFGVQATGDRSAALGFTTFATGFASTAAGHNNTSSGQYATSFGFNNTASGQSSVAMNFQNTASGQASLAFGFGNNVSSLDSVAGGRRGVVTSESSFHFGESNETGTGATSTEQMLFGRFLSPPRDGAGEAFESQFVVGRYNRNFNQQHAAFTVGTGVDNNNRANSFVVRYNGEIVLESVLGSNFKFADDAAAGAAGLSAGAIYQTDGTGAAPLNVAGILMIKQ